MTSGTIPPGAADVSALLAVNREALGLYRPYALSRIFDGLPEGPRPEVVRSSAGPVTLAIRSAGRAFDLHSRFDPRVEAAALVAESEIGQSSSIVVFGFGAGYVVEAALEAAPLGSIVTVAVIDPQVMLTALATRDLSALLGDPRLRLALGTLKEIAGALPTGGEDLSIVCHLPLLTVASPALAPLAEMAKELQAQARSARLQRALVLDNLARNLPAILRAPHVGALEALLGERPALLVAPGPSLEQDLAHLRLTPRPILMALDTALSPLLAAEIVPDLVVTLDPLPTNLKKFEKQLSSIPIVFFEGARPEVVRFAENSFFACERGGLLDRSHPWFGRGGRFSSEGSVLLAALDILLRTGAAPIVLLGADLALEAGRMHAGRETVTDLETTIVPARDGGEVFTTASLWRHRRRLIRRLQELPPERVLDATSRGAMLPGVRRVQLAAWLEEWRACAPPLAERSLAISSLAAHNPESAERDEAHASALTRLLGEASRVAGSVPADERSDS